MFLPASCRIAATRHKSDTYLNLRNNKINKHALKIPVGKHQVDNWVLECVYRNRGHSDNETQSDGRNETIESNKSNPANQMSGTKQAHFENVGVYRFSCYLIGFHRLNGHGLSKRTVICCFGMHDSRASKLLLFSLFWKLRIEGNVQWSQNYFCLILTDFFFFNFILLIKTNFLVATLATCPDPGSPEKGFRVDRLEEFIVGTEVEIGCEINTKLHGTSKRKCLPSGEWTGEQPTCVSKWKRFWLIVGWKVTVVVTVWMMGHRSVWKRMACTIARFKLLLDQKILDTGFLEFGVQHAEIN